MVLSVKNGIFRYVVIEIHSHHTFTDRMPDMCLATHCVFLCNNY